MQYNWRNLPARTKGLQRIWLHPRDRYRAVTQTYNNCAETHLSCGVMSPFVSPLLPSLERMIQLSLPLHWSGLSEVISISWWYCRVICTRCGCEMISICGAYTGIYWSTSYSRYVGLQLLSILTTGSPLVLNIRSHDKMALQWWLTLFSEKLQSGIAIFTVTSAAMSV